MDRRLTALTLAALACVAMSGCDRRGGEQATGTSAVPTTGSAAPSLPNLATPETAGKPTFQLKLGQPASFAKGGVTITVTPKTLEPVDGVPSGLEDDLHNCGSWWKLTEDIAVDAQPNSTWTGWYSEYVGLAGLHSTQTARSSYGGRYGDIYMSGSGKHIPDSEVAFIGKAMNDFTHDPKAALRRSGTAVEYIATCARKDGHGAPSEKPPVGLVWNQELEKGQDADKRPDAEFFDNLDSGGALSPDAPKSLAADWNTLSGQVADRVVQLKQCLGDAHRDQLTRYSNYMESTKGNLEKYEEHLKDLADGTAAAKSTVGQLMGALFGSGSNPTEATRAVARATQKLYYNPGSPVAEELHYPGQAPKAPTLEDFTVPPKGADQHKPAAGGASGRSGSGGGGVGTLGGDHERSLSAKTGPAGYAAPKPVVDGNELFGGDLPIAAPDVVGELTPKELQKMAEPLAKQNSGSASEV